MTVGSPWLVTGASGFLGRHLLESLDRTRPARRCLALVRDRAGWEAMAWTRGLTRVEPLIGDVTQTSWWAERPAAPSLEGIFHLAALISHRQRDADQVRRINVTGTVNAVRLAARHRCRLVFVSTSGTVGCFRDPGSTADETAPWCESEVRNWPYYRSKIEAEREATTLARELDVELVILRPPVLLGPRDHRLRSVGHVLRLLQGRLPFLIEGGMHFADVRDVAPALVRAMEHPHPRSVYHLPGTRCTIREFYDLIAELAGLRPPKRVIPYRLARFLARATHGLGLRILPEPALVEMAAHYWGLTSRYAAADLEYRSRPGRDTLRDTITWWRERNS